MLVPESWLREYVPAAPSIEAIEARLQLTGTAADGLDHVGVPGGATDGYRVGQVVRFEQHPNADRLRLVTVDVGEGDHERQIVCGASNFQARDRVAVILPGATLPDGEILGSAKLRGIESFGMMLSERELELSDDHDGIMILPADWEVGSSLADHLPLGDTVLDLEITSNRPDCLAVVGVAREVAAAFDIPLVEPSRAEPERTGSGDVLDVVSVNVEDHDLCARYMALAFTGVTVGPSPAWLKARLARAGMRSINNVVDVTNYAMLALGQPLHAFDADTITGGALTVRRAAAGEAITTLDEVARTLTTDDLVIADADGPAVIAGVMGSARAGVTTGTTRIVLESAAFSGPAIMRTSARLGLRSESSTRFEKGLHPRTTIPGMLFAARLLVDVCGAQLVPGTIDVRDKWLETSRLTLPRTELARILGIEIPDADVSRILTALGFAPQPTDDGAGWNVITPYWRDRDVTRVIDLVEEVGRVYGYDQIPFALPSRRSVSRGLSPAQRTRRVLEDTAAGLGLSQTITYSLVAPVVNERYGSGSAEAVVMSHPMSVDQAQLRQTLIGSLLPVLQRNVAAGERDVAVFETSAVFTNGGGVGDDGLHRYSTDRDVIAFAATGSLGGGRFDRAGITADFAAAAGIADALARAAGVTIQTWPFPEGTAPAFLHPGRAAVVTGGDVRIGWIGELHPSVIEEHDLRDTGIVGELDIDSIVVARSSVPPFRPFGTQPPIRQDIAVLLADEVHAQAVLDAVRVAGGDLLESVSVFDRYVGTGVPDGQHSLALRLVFRAPDRTLTDDEVLPVREAIVAALAEHFGAVLRG